MEQVISGNLPVLALRGLVIYPDQTIHFDVGRMKSILALEAAMKRDQIIMLVPQKDILVDEPDFKDLYTMGTVVRVKQILKSQGETIRVLVNGLHRAKIVSATDSTPYLRADVEYVEETKWTDSVKLTELRRQAINLFTAYCEFVDKSVQPVNLRILTMEDCGQIADTIAQNSSIEFKDKIRVLTQLNPVRRLE